jgi:multiple sugar transport system substrate-binding protein
MKRWKLIGGLTVSAALVALAPGTAVAQSAPKLTGKTHGVTITFMIASSGTAETNADKAAATAWGKLTGNKVNMINASNINLDLTEGFAGGSPPDVFYAQTNLFESMAKQGQLLDSGSLIAPSGTFFPSLVNAFTYNHTFYCVPKDSSTLAIEINTADWKAAGLTNADLPTTWAKLAYDAKVLTKGKTAGLVVSASLDRLGAFFAEAGGSYMNASRTAFTFDSPQNVAALTYIEGMAKAGYLKFATQVDASWGGQALGDGSAAMTVEGNWIIGAMQSTYPKISYEVVPMPAGPGGHNGTLVFTDCWGIAASSKYTAADVSFVKYLSSATQELKFANAFGVMPSRPSVASQWAAEHTTPIATGATGTPAVSPFVQGDAYGMPQVATIGFPTVQAAFEAQILGLSNGSSNPKQMLQQLQTNAEALLQP